MASSNGFGNVPTSLTYEHNPFEQSFASKSQGGSERQPASQAPKPPASGDGAPHPGEAQSLPGIQELASPGSVVPVPGTAGWQTQLRMSSILGQPSEGYGAPAALPSPPVLIPPTQARPNQNTPVGLGRNITRNLSSENLAANSLYMMSNGAAVHQGVPQPPRSVPLRESSTEPTSQNESENSPGPISSRKRLSDASDGGNLSPNEKRRQFLERNRIAAVKCRQRKKQYMDDLKGKANYLLSVNDELNMEIHNLRNQMETLKGYIVSHNDIRTLPGPVLNIIESMQRPHQVYGTLPIIPSAAGPMSAPATAAQSPVIAGASRPMAKVEVNTSLPSTPRGGPASTIEASGLPSR